MAEKKIYFIKRTFGELKAGVMPDAVDPHRIMSSLGPKMREAVLNNPSGYKDDDVCQLLALDGKTVVGATNPYPGRLYVKGEIVPILNGSYLFAHENYRKDNVGGELFYRETNLHPLKNTLFAGISQMALPLYHALKYTVFEFPRLIYLRRSKSVVQSIMHSEAGWTKPIIWATDLILYSHRVILHFFTSLRLGKYSVKEIKDTPQEVESIVLSEGKSYMELHDRAWFNWSLNYSISEDERTKKRLYIVRNDDRIEGFFLIKQEFFEQASSRGFKNVYLGSVMEWGITPDSHLTEKDLTMLSLSCFDKDVDGIQYASTDMKTIKKLKWCLFVQVGSANIGFRLRSIKDVSIKDINNWRIRLAASDTVLN